MKVNYRWLKWTLLTVALASLLVVGGCKKKAAPAAAPPAAPPPPQPKATLSVSPESIQRGQSATLTWSTEDATTVTIEGIGGVDRSGSKAVTPSASTTYRLTAKGDGGSADATARLTVVEPPPPPVAQTQPVEDLSALFNSSIKDIYFDYDRFELRAQDQITIDADAAFLRAHPQIMFTIEGHCDERGSTDYNLELGDSRANAARDALIKAGVPASQIKTISYGKERPFCTESNEACWQQNRRDHFVYGH
jgi:peptidoglycan-associated lipoprotein